MALDGLLDVADHQCLIAKQLRETGAKPTWDTHWHALRLAAYHFIYSSHLRPNVMTRVAVLTELKRISQEQAIRLDPTSIWNILRHQVSKRKTRSSGTPWSFSAFATKRMIVPVAASGSDNDKGQTQQFARIDIITVCSNLTLEAVTEFVKDQQKDIALNLTIVETQPNCDAARLTAQLTEALPRMKTKPHVNIKIVPQSRTYLHISNKSIILLAADYTTSTGHVIAKSGSAQLASIANSYAKDKHCEVVVLMEEEGIAGPLIHDLKNLRDSAKRQAESKTVRELRFKNIRKITVIELDYEKQLKRDDDNGAHATWPEDVREKLLPYTTGQHNDQNSKISVKAVRHSVDVVDEAHIDHYISSIGEMSQLEILNKSIEWTRYEKKVFGDLYDGYLLTSGWQKDSKT
ncbi:hypothetical protein OHC33_010499 [Knufia fluminis]|uniref:Uncharacterized protein n=1 Tax=Knufia fluminis TaxID=191047 RepID=A0AAN8EFK3_9EURO|nr:hypothetical protein OHC33_010499 [Knufia fluminis]